ncbi:hypothetical protein D3C71_1164210 [compost metagenome]
MGDTYFIMVIYLAMPILFYIVLPYWICVVQGKSLQWVWWDLLLYTFLMLALVAVRFKSNKWRGINIIEERKLEMQ